MSDEFTEEQSTIHDLTEKGREKLADAQEGAQDALAAVTKYIRANPWVAVAGAAVIGGVVAALSHKKQARHHGNLDAVRDWLEDAHARLPSQKQVQSIAESAGVPDFLKQLRKKLHLD